jgi:hypothetical protein
MFIEQICIVAVVAAAGSDSFYLCLLSPADDQFAGAGPVRQSADGAATCTGNIVKAGGVLYVCWDAQKPAS